MVTILHSPTSTQLRLSCPSNACGGTRDERKWATRQKLGRAASVLDGTNPHWDLPVTNSMEIADLAYRWQLRAHNVCRSVLFGLRCCNLSPFTASVAGTAAQMK